MRAHVRTVCVPLALAGFENGDRTPISPLWPIGHGLSFTSFNVSELRAPPNVSLAGSKAKDASFVLEASVRNTGALDGDVTLFATCKHPPSPRVSILLHHV